MAAASTSPRRTLLVGSFALVGVAAAALCIPVPADGVLLLVGSGEVRARTGPGLALRNPFTTRSVHLPDGRATLETTWRLRLRVGRPVRIRLQVGPDASGSPERLLEQVDGLQAFLDRAASDIRLDVEASLSRSAGGGDADEETLLQAALGDALQRRSLRIVSLELDPVAAAAAVVPQDTGVRLLLIGLDSADWDLIDPLIEAGRLPNLARLRREGAWGTLRSTPPLLSPLLWTTVATGKPPDIHGIVDFVMIDPTSGNPIPISSHFRRVKAFWNILSEAGLSVDVVGWWATWPAESVEGVMVTDRVAYSLFEYDRAADDQGATFPPSYRAAASDLLVGPTDILWEDARRLAPIDRDAFERSTAALATADEETYHDSLNNLRRTLAGTLTYHRIALDLLRRAPPRLLAVYYQGLDEVNHRFAHLLPPALPLAEAGEARRFGGTIDAFYELQDRLVGEILAAAPADTTVMVLSDHGFANGAERPLEFLPYIEAGLPGRWHTLDGIWLLHGPVAQPGRLAQPVRLDQVTPTALRLLGLPLAADMEGDAVEGAIRSSFLDRHPPRTIATYEDGEAGTDPAVARLAPAAADDEMLARLRSLGYLAPAGTTDGHGGPAAGTTSANYHANLGSIRLDRREHARAADDFRAALELNPRHLVARGGLIQIDILEGRDAEALDAILRLVEETAGYDPVFYSLAAQLFLRTGRNAEGLRWFRTLAAARPHVPQVQTGLGLMLQSAGDRAGARDAYRSALDRKPDALFALQELYTLEMESGDLAELMDRIGAAMAVTPRAVLPYNWAGLVLRRMGRPGDAEKSFRRALEFDPDSLHSLVNLSSLLVDEGRHEEAIPLCRRALDLDGESVEPRVNLIVALGGARRSAEARAVFDAGGGEDAATVELLNAMAFAAYLNGGAEEARGLLERSLRLRPDQDDASRLLDRVRGGR